MNILWNIFSGKELFLKDASMMDSDVQFLKQGILIGLIYVYLKYLDGME